MRKIKDIESRSQLITMMQLGMDGALFKFRYKARDYTVIASNGGGWDHVSISSKSRTPTWEVMAKVKDIFFESNEVVMQLHPAKENYVNLSEHCLHLWKPQNEAIPVPPIEFV